MSVGKNYILVMAVCGLFAGLAGSPRRARLAVPDRDQRHPDPVPLGYIGIAVALLGREHRRRDGGAALLFGALLSGTSQRNLDPTIFEPLARLEPHLHHPGPRRPDRERRRARAGVDQAGARPVRPRARPAGAGRRRARAVSASTLAGGRAALGAHRRLTGDRVRPPAALRLAAAAHASHAAAVPPARRAGVPAGFYAAREGERRLGWIARGISVMGAIARSWRSTRARATSSASSSGPRSWPACSVSGRR